MPNRTSYEDIMCIIAPVCFPAVWKRLVKLFTIQKWQEILTSCLHVRSAPLERNAGQGVWNDLGVYLQNQRGKSINLMFHFMLFDVLHRHLQAAISMQKGKQKFYLPRLKCKRESEAFYVMPWHTLIGLSAWIDMKLICACLAVLRHLRFIHRRVRRCWDYSLSAGEQVLWKFAWYAARLDVSLKHSLENTTGWIPFHGSDLPHYKHI